MSAFECTLQQLLASYHNNIFTDVAIIIINSKDNITNKLFSNIYTKHFSVNARLQCN